MSFLARIILSLSLVASLAACGDGSGVGSVLNSNGLSGAVGTWNLISVDDVSVPANDSAIVSVMPETADLGASVDNDCSGTIWTRVTSTGLELLDDGTSHNGCFISFSHQSNHTKVAAYLAMGAEIEFNETDLLLRSPSGEIYKFQK